MQPSKYRRLAVLALLAGSLASIASAPATMSGDNECLETKGYVTVNGTPHGVPSYTCIVRTDCTGWIGHDQQHITVGPIGAGAGISVPLPAGTNVTCYL